MTELYKDKFPCHPTFQIDLSRNKTIDWTLKNGLTEIPIEERDHEEVSHIQGLLDDNDIKKVNIFTRLMKSLNYLIWGDV